MNFVEVNVAEVKKAAQRKKIMNMIEEFWLSEAKAVKVEFNEKEYKDVRSARSSLHKAIKRMNVGIILVQRGENLYLVKENL